MVDQGETAEKEGEKGKTHNKGQNIRDLEHLHTVLSHLIGKMGRWTDVMDGIVNVVIIEILAHKTN